MTRAGLKRAIAATYQDVQDHHTFQVAAALSYYTILAVFPGLIFLSAVTGSIPFTDLFARTLDVMARVLPPDAMRFVQSMLLDLIGANHKAWLSFGTLGLIWVASTAFDAAIEALDIAYDVKDNRPLWKTRLLALVLGGVCVALWIAALAVMIVGPEFGAWLGTRIPVSREFVVLWPLIHWTVAISFTVLAVEAVYFLAPKVRQRFLATLPGALLAVTSWIALSYLLGVYFRHFANYNRTYGTLAGFTAFLTWLYWNAFALLLGAELNAKLTKECAQDEETTPRRIEPGPQVPSAQEKEISSEQEREEESSTTQERSSPQERGKDATLAIPPKS
ncbi:MAG: YihY/virulence factor BrkB family protein [Terriglobales bacterium]